MEQCARAAVLVCLSLLTLAPSAALGGA